MAAKTDIDVMIHQVQALDRNGCINRLRELGDLHLDFTQEFLEAMSLERLQHVVMAALLQVRKRKLRKSA